MLRNIVVLLVMALALSVAGTDQATAGTLTYYVDRDSEIDLGTPDANYGTAVDMQVNSGSNRKRSICHADLSMIMPGVKINGAKLHLFLYDPAEPRVYAVHRVNPGRNWKEYEVTWNRYTATGLWTTPGGDYASQWTDTIYTGSSPNPHWVDWDVTADVEFFINNPDKNSGWIIRDTAEMEPNSNYTGHIRTRDFSGGKNGGQIIIDYEPTSVTVTAVEARATAAGVRLTWNTANEDMIGGFNVLRAQGTDYVQANEYPIPARGGAAGTSYAYVDAKGTAGDTYLLEVIELSGTNTRIGPIQVCASGTDEGHGLPVPSFLKASPNPAAGPVVFAFGGTSSELRVYDVSGQLVRTLTGVKGAAGYTARWDRTDAAGHRVAPGIYFGQTGSQQVKLTSF